MLTVAFDLDLTLVDTREGFRAALSMLARESGRVVDVEQAVGRLGVPMADELAHWFDDEQVPAAVVRLRDLFLEVGVPLCIALPSASSALTHLRDQGFSIQVITSRHPDVANALLNATSLAARVSHLDGFVFGQEKVPALLRTSPVAFVGDHPADMLAAVQAGTNPVGVLTGNHSRSSLRDAGAAIVLRDLSELTEQVHVLLGQS